MSNVKNAAEVRRSRLAKLADEMLMASGSDLGHAVLEVSRKARIELAGQDNMIPDTRTRDVPSDESLVVWDYMVELADRLISDSGATILRTSEEKDLSSFKGMSHRDFRTSFSHVMMNTDFRFIGQRLRSVSGFEDNGDLNMADILGQPYELGNIIEMATASLALKEPEVKKHKTDLFSVRIRMAVVNARRAQSLPLADENWDKMQTFSREVGSICAKHISARQEERAKSSHIENITRSMIALDACDSSVEASTPSP